MRPVCIPCLTEMRPDKNGVHVAPNPDVPTHQYAADQWKCPKCGHVILSGFSLSFNDTTRPLYVLNAKSNDSPSKQESESAQVEADRAHPACDLAVVGEDLGYTDDWRGALFLTPDGRLLDGAQVNEGGTPGLRALDHRYVSDDLMEDDMLEGARTKALMRWLRATRCVRINTSRDELSLSWRGGITVEQRNAIALHIKDGFTYPTVTIENLNAEANSVCHDSVRFPGVREIVELLNWHVV